MDKLITAFPSNYLRPRFVAIQIAATKQEARPFQAAVFLGTADGEGAAVVLEKYGTDVNTLILETAKWLRQMFSEIVDIVLVFHSHLHSPHQVSLHQLEAGLRVALDHDPEDAVSKLIGRLKKGEVFVAPTTGVIQ